MNKWQNEIISAKHMAADAASRIDAYYRWIGEIKIDIHATGAPLLDPVLLCGTMFGLKTFRHRLFESSFFMLAPPHASHRHYGKATQQGRPVTATHQFITVTRNFSGVNVGKAAMGIDWMSKRELTQAIPPAYTEWIGERLLEAILYEREA